MAKRKGGQKWAKRERPVYGWYRPGTVLTSGMVGTGDGVAVLCGASALMPSGDPNYPLDRTATRGNLVWERMIVRIIAYAVSTGVAQLIKFVWGIRMDELDADGTARPVADMPKVAVGDSDSRREDWVWRAMGILQVPAAAGTVVTFPQPDKDSWTFGDCKPRRPFKDRMGIVLHWHATVVGTLATNSDVTFEVNAEPELLFRLPTAR